MKLRDRYKPYIRRANGREKAESIRDAIRLTYFRMLKKPFYVMVQRGWPNLVIGVGANKAEIKKGPLATGWYGFRGWANILKHKAQGIRSEEEREAFSKRAYVMHASARSARRWRARAAKARASKAAAA